MALQAQADASQAISGTTVAKSAFEQVETGRTDGPAPQVGPGRTQRYSYGSADAVDSLLTIRLRVAGDPARSVTTSSATARLQGTAGGAGRDRRGHRSGGILAVLLTLCKQKKGPERDT